ncbi:hypothetical protein ASD65_08995 [Microbacterium sp. Root61]|uniref:carbohydrate kinase family protein n=1 Tax=Microbacterium sp. Root61 TaxID=1736570 RepID=UPI000700429E|nr:carbohydrate kinase family protein [Microbacterium sp. Root61]KRA24538.1 hypothetical protein ASD65_08995 [Microbacterium sp. Root61]
MTGSVSVVGYASLDDSVEIHEFRGVDATSIVRRRSQGAASGIGGVAHIARAVAASDAPVMAVSWVGDDEGGHAWSAALVETGTGVDGVAVHGSRTPSSTMIEIASGGTICLFDPGDCYPDTLTDGQASALTASDWVIMTVAPRALTTAVLDSIPSGARLAWAVKHDDDVYTPELMRRMLQRADLVSFSRGERDYVLGADRASTLRPDALVVETQGADGVSWHLAGDASRAGAVAVERVRDVDTTGAGDTFIGTLVGLIAQGAAPSQLSDSEITALIARSTHAVGALLRSRTADSAATQATQKENH